MMRDKAGVTQILMSHPDLVLPDGRVAETLDRYELAHALIAIGVEGVTVNTPKFESLQTYRAHLEDIKNAAVKSYSTARLNQQARGKHNDC
jgi:hypothetical protein